MKPADKPFFEPETLKPVETKYEPMPHHIMNLSWTASGYGERIPTAYMARIGKRWHRVYSCRFSNIGSVYVVRFGKRFIVDLS